ncbi:MAG TPA: alanine racemase, partial [Aggregatilineales bacterium]|nr:alanine racemase [Aggregatilineales bacterium]
MSGNSRNFVEDRMASGHTTRFEIDLDAILHNLQQIRQCIGDSVELMPVVKANAYGHGAIEVARAAAEAGANRIGVARVMEGVQLREAGIVLPIVILAYAIPDEMPLIVRFDLTPTITEFSVAERLSALAVAARKIISTHLKVDTGMGRYGWLPDEVVPNLKIFAALP